MCHKFWGKFVVAFCALISLFCFGKLSVSASVQTDFINQMKAPIIKVSRENHLYASVMMAQAMLESDCGQSELATQGNNYFGIKGSYDGQSVTMNTQEMTEKGKTVSTSAVFKKYPTLLESIEDNARILRNGTDDDPQLYSGTWTTNSLSASDAAMALSSTYATDMEYGDKLNHLINTYHLEKLDTSPSSTNINDKIAAEIKQQMSKPKPVAQTSEETVPSKITNRKIEIASQHVFQTKHSKQATRINLPIEHAIQK